MPLYMDVHTLGDSVGAGDVAKAQPPTRQTQGAYGVDYQRYWVDESNGKIFCLVEAPDADTAATVHREAHGLVADEIYEVSEGSDPVQTCQRVDAEKVSQSSIDLASYPVSNQRIRCSDDPCVQPSGSISPPEGCWMRSSPTVLAASSASVDVGAVSRRRS